MARLRRRIRCLRSTQRRLRQVDDYTANYDMGDGHLSSFRLRRAKSIHRAADQRRKSNVTSRGKGRVVLTNGQFFFLMNLAFNAVMWGLFTRALTLASSTVRVSVINTSANFMLTAVLGLLIFKETLPGKPSWTLGSLF